MLQTPKKEINENTVNCPYLIRATIQQIDVNTGKILHTGDMLVGRTKTYNQARKYIKKVRNHLSDVHVGFNGHELVYKEKVFERNPLTVYRQFDKKTIKEVIKSIDIIKQ